MIILANTRNFNFLDWLKECKEKNQSPYKDLRSVYRAVYCGVLEPIEKRKIISFADITNPDEKENYGLTDFDFLHLSRDCRIKANFNMNKKRGYLKNLDSQRSVYDYGMDMWHLSRIIKRQLNNPEREILKANNGFYVWDVNGLIVKINVYYQRQTSKILADNYFQIQSPKRIDS